jgi:hypothetical protein
VVLSRHDYSFDGECYSVKSYVAGANNRASLKLCAVTFYSFVAIVAIALAEHRCVAPVGMSV